MSLTKFCSLFRVSELEKHLWGFGLLGEQIRAVMIGKIFPWLRLNWLVWFICRVRQFWWVSGTLQL